jgi:hypothetical protein
MQAIVSIHDLMPETMERVERILEYLKRKEVPPVTLLVVPGKPWTPADIKRLQMLADRGHPLAAHGWHHHTQPRKLYHRLHAALISRNVAEHLDLNSPAILELLERSRAWFPRHDLPTPDLYVPPAWALGFISKNDLAQTTFSQIEVTRGLIKMEERPPCRPETAQAVRQNSKKIHFEKLPLAGFEADTTLRATFLKQWNRAQSKKAIRTNRSLRISIHPDDLELRLKAQLSALLEHPWEYCGYD